MSVFFCFFLFGQFLLFLKLILISLLAPEISGQPNEGADNQTFRKMGKEKGGNAFYRITHMKNRIEESSGDKDQADVQAEMTGSIVRLPAFRPAAKPTPCQCLSPPVR